MNTSNSTTPLYYLCKSTPPTISPYTLIWNATNSTIEDLNGPYHTPLPTDLAVATRIQEHAHHSIKWIFDKISAPLKTGDGFWFRPEPSISNTTLLLGNLSAIGYFIGGYALVEISPISHFDPDHDWMVEKGDIFWMKTEDLILNDEQQQEARRALLKNSMLMLLDTDSDKE